MKEKEFERALKGSNIYRILHPEELTVEELAKELHESVREAVENRKVLVKNPKFSKFLEWDEITEDAREGRRIQARYLLRKFKVIKNGIKTN